MIDRTGQVWEQKFYGGAFVYYVLGPPVLCRDDRMIDHPIFELFYVEPGDCALSTSRESVSVPWEAELDMRRLV